MTRAKKTMLIYLATTLLVLKRNRRQNGKFQVHPLYRIRRQQGEFFSLMHLLERYPIKFFEYFRMGRYHFNFILSKIRKDIRVKFNIYRPNLITAKEKLVLTLRFLATGASFADLSFRFLMGKTTVRKCILETIRAINKHLLNLVMPVPKSPEDWEKIASSFLKHWNFPNCLGAVDGKHVRMFAPRKSGSLHFNYKKCFSTVLMAIVDAEYKFVMVSIGAYGSNADPTVFASSNFGKAWLNYPQNLYVPADVPLPDTVTPMPYVLVGDEAFGLKYNLMTPYSGTHLTPKQRIYNYRLSRARRMVESGFGIFAHTWRVLLKPLEVQMQLAKPLILCCCILNNFLKYTKEKLLLTPSQPTDSSTFNLVDHEKRANQPASNAVNIRSNFADWFVNEGNLEYQWDKNFLTN